MFEIYQLLIELEDLFILQIMHNRNNITTFVVLKAYLIASPNVLYLLCSLLFC